MNFVKGRQFTKRSIAKDGCYFEVKYTKGVCVCGGGKNIFVLERSGGLSIDKEESSYFEGKER